MTILAPVDLAGPIDQGRLQAYDPALPGDMALSTSTRQQAARIEAWLEGAAPLAGIALDPPPRYRASFERAAAATREPLTSVAADVARRFVDGEDTAELLAEATERAARAEFSSSLVLDLLDGYDFAAAADRMSAVAGRLSKPFAAAVKALTAAAADLPEPWLAKPDVVSQFAGYDVPSWDEAGAFGQAAKADRSLAPTVWKAEDALARLAACAVTRHDHWLSEVVAFDEEADTIGNDRLKLSIFEAHGVADLALVAVARGDLPSLSFKLRQP
ncbi:hypothetical protein [Branchiibius cervicis]|uniref:DUF222 domain-containing protein n=1 Tax=Branchiibius cervicis TaxID=908252 RepID=A0ABW2APM2_9MICO